MASIKDLKQGQPVKLKKLTKESRKTSPPSRFSEVVLAKHLSDLNIGRPSTLSSIVTLIQDRGYVKKKGSQLYPTPLGFAIARILAAKFPEFTAYEYTSQMEDNLDEIADGKQDKTNFLEGFWNGPDGIAESIKKVLDSIDYDEIQEFSTIDLHNGYQIRYSKFGTFLQDPNGTPNEKGYVPSAKIDDDADVWDYRDADYCKEIIEKNATSVGPRELGQLTSGEYSGWTVYAKDGRFGAFIQAMHPDHVKAISEDKKPGVKVPKPVNHKVPEGLDVDSVKLSDISSLFAEVKLPRWSADGKWLVGIGKKGAYMGRKATAKGRPVFRSLTEEHDPRTVSFDLVKKLWDEKDQEAKAKESKPKATKAAPKTAPKKATKVTPKPRATKTTRAKS